MKLYNSIPDSLADWASRQPVFFTGSASLHGQHINVSPKGQTSSLFSVLDAHTCAYIDCTGSGCETISHAYENGRLCLLFISFGSLPRILRFFCKSEVIESDDPRFDEWIKKVSKGKRESVDGARAVIVAHVWQVQTSCGFGVPRVKRGLYKPDHGSKVEANGTEKEDDVVEAAEKMKHMANGANAEVDELIVFEERPTMEKSNGLLMVDDKANKYRAGNNVRSLDGLPGLKTARRYNGEWLLAGDVAAWFRRLFAQKCGMGIGFLVAVLLFCFLEFTALLPRHHLT